MPQVGISGPRGELPAYLAVPPGEGPWPGVVVIHDVAGHDPRPGAAQADWLAERGLPGGCAGPVPLRVGGCRCVQAAFRDALARRGGYFDEIEAARTLARRRRPDCTGKVGVIGFCMGGGFALLLAAGPRVFGRECQLRLRAEGRCARCWPSACPIVGSYGAKDRLAARRARPVGACSVGGSASTTT